MGDNWLTEAQPGLPKLLFFSGCEVGMALRQKIDCFGHPLDLLFFQGIDYAALADRTEQFVTSSIECSLRLLQLGPVQSSFTRQHFLLGMARWVTTKRRSFARPNAKNRRDILRVAHGLKYNLVNKP
jgi:hypothetical protein